MTQIAYILGTSHIYQREDDSCEIGSIEAFIKYLNKICHSYGINAIGEEMSVSALEDYNRIESIPAKFATAHGKFHKYCDPTRDEKIKLGIKEPHDVRLDAKLKGFSEEEAKRLDWEEALKREPYWLYKIQELNKWPLLFICGANHVESFTSLLATNTVVAHVVNQDWSPNITE
jgi:hypothetical protein